jgi:hypothetical protein
VLGGAVLGGAVGQLVLAGVLDEPPVTGTLGAELEDTEPDAGDDDVAGGLDDTGGGGVDLLTRGLGAGAEPQSELADALAVEPTGPELLPVPGSGVVVPLGVTDGDGSGDEDGLTGGELLAGSDGESLAEPVPAGLDLVVVLAAAVGEQDDAAAGADAPGWWPGVVG